MAPGDTTVGRTPKWWAREGEGGVGEAQVVPFRSKFWGIIEGWRVEYNHHRPHSALDYDTPAQKLATFTCH